MARSQGSTRMAQPEAWPVHSIEMEARRFSGAVAARIIAIPAQVVSEHAHDWPILSLYILGEHRKVHELGEDVITGPSAVLHAAGARHSNIVGNAGLEQLDILFDPAWLDVENGAPLEHVRCWQGGQVGAAARTLACEWLDLDRSEAELKSRTAEFIRSALSSRRVRQPLWMDRVSEALSAENPPPTRELAQQVGLHPAWLAQAYRTNAGEGVRETLQRRRVERAAALLREGTMSQAQIAAAAGYCDQSHMIRSFLRLLRRTPSQVRAERCGEAERQSGRAWC